MTLCGASAGNIKNNMEQKETSNKYKENIDTFNIQNKKILKETLSSKNQNINTSLLETKKIPPIRSKEIAGKSIAESNIEAKAAG